MSRFKWVGEVEVIDKRNPRNLHPTLASTLSLKTVSLCEVSISSSGKMSAGQRCEYNWKNEVRQAGNELYGSGSMQSLKKAGKT
jgi:hypothetical protein